MHSSAHLLLKAIGLVAAVALFAAAPAIAHGGGDGEHDPINPPGWRDVAKFEPTLNAMMSELHAWSGRLWQKPQAPPSNEHCAHCVEVAELVEKLFTQQKSLEEIELVVDALCDSLIHNTSDPFNKVCRDIPALVQKVVKYGEATKANITNVACADFARACVQKCCLASTAPEQVHLAYAQSDMVAAAVDMRVAWVTEENVTDAVAKFSIDGGASWHVALPETDTYDVGGWIGVLYFAVMPQLPSNTTVLYQVGAEAGGWSAVFNFTTLPLNAGSTERPLRIIGVADMGFGPNGRPSVSAIQREVERGTVDVVLHPGDIGYADGDQAWWDDFMRLMQPIMSRVPYMTGPGNHECIWYNCTAYKKRFRMPATGLGAPADAMWYALRAKPAGLAMVMLDSETWYDTPNIGPGQRAWIRKAFAAPEAADAPFRFVMHHRPLYCLSTSTECTVNAPHLRGQVEGLYRELGVAAVMVGHIHNYQRTYPVFNNTVVSRSYTDASAPASFINGGAGNREGQMRFTGPTYEWAAEYTTERTYMQYVVYRDESSGNVTMEATTIRSRTNEVVDRLTIVRSPSALPPG